MSSMRLEMLMKQKLTTELRMAPHIIQSIEILTLPILELHTFIQKQLEANPVLETLENPGTETAGEKEGEFTQNETEQDRPSTTIFCKFRKSGTR